jgi:malate/lactate dehydrogenase
MKVTVIGTGNVGSALLFPLAADDAVELVFVMSRKEQTAIAAMMDVASANPTGAAKMRFDEGEGQVPVT